MTETGNLYPAVRAVKVFFGEDIRRFSFVGSTVEQLCNSLKELTTLPIEGFSLRYQDEEGDWISIGSDAELNHAFALSGEKALRMKIEPSRRIASVAEPSIVVAAPVVRPHVTVAPLNVTTRREFKELKKELKDQAKQVKKQMKDEIKAAKTEFRREWKDHKREKEPKGFVARFVKHVTVEDDYEFNAGTAFVKTWRFRNEGSVTWPEKCVFLFVGKKGDQLNAPSQVIVDRAVAPGEEIDVSVGMIAPMEPGSYCGYWRMAEPSGRKFGQRVRVLIKVAGSSSSSDSDENVSSTWGEMLNQLEGMGFKDKGLNVKLLVKTQGNLDKVVQRLLKREEKKSGVKGNKH